jgi:C-terminal processing protease CtpA/Prc
MALVSVATLTTGAAAFADDGLMSPFAQLGRGRLGVRVQAMTEDLREFFGAPADRGVLVAKVEPDSAASQAGVLVGDVIVFADGRPVRRPLDLTAIIESTGPPHEVTLVVLRDRERLTLRAQVKASAIPRFDRDRWTEMMREGFLEGSEALRRQLESLQERLEKLEKEFREQRDRDKAEKQAT